MPDPFLDDPTNARPNSQLTMKTSGARWVNLGRITPHADEYSAVAVVTDDGYISNAYIVMNATTDKGIVVRGDSAAGGKFTAEDIVVTTSGNANAAGVQIDTGSGANLESAVLRRIRLANTICKVARVDDVLIEGLTIEDAVTYGVSIGEDVGRFVLKPDPVSGEGVDINGWVSHFPVGGEPLVDDLEIVGATIIGRHDHMQARRAVWKDCTIDIDAGLGIGIDDETPTADVESRRLINVAFIGTGSPFVMGTGFGDASKVTCIGCTHNGAAWSL